jgi:hypothetical protein
MSKAVLSPIRTSIAIISSIGNRNDSSITDRNYEKYLSNNITSSKKSRQMIIHEFRKWLDHELNSCG